MRQGKRQGPGAVVQLGKHKGILNNVPFVLQHFNQESSFFLGGQTTQIKGIIDTTCNL